MDRIGFERGRMVLQNAPRRASDVGGLDSERLERRKSSNSHSVSMRPVGPLHPPSSNMLRRPLPSHIHTSSLTNLCVLNLLRLPSPLSPPHPLYAHPGFLVPGYDTSGSSGMRARRIRSSITRRGPPPGSLVSGYPALTKTSSSFNPTSVLVPATPPQKPVSHASTSPGLASSEACCISPLKIRPRPLRTPICRGRKLRRD